MRHDRLPGRVSSQFPPVSTARSTMTEPGLIVATISAVMSRGAGLPGICAVVIDQVHVRQMSGDRREHVALLLLAQLAGIAARGFGGRGHRGGLDEGRAEALHLLLHRGTHVERARPPRRAGAPWRSPGARRRRRR